MDHIKGILFDKDGTLFDFQSTWGVWAASFFLDLAQGDLGLAAKLCLQMGYDVKAHRFHKDSVIISHTAAQVAAKIGKIVPGWDAAELLDHVNQTAAAVPQVQPVSLVPLLKGFRARGLKLGVATNDAEAPTRAHLDRAGVTELFDFIAGSDSGFGGKPETGMMVGFCETVGLQPSEVLMIGDSVHDLVAGKVAGMGTVAVLTGVSEAHELAPHADVVLADIGGIVSLLGR